MTSGKYLSINLKSFLLYPLGTLKKLRKAKLRVVYTPLYYLLDSNVHLHPFVNWNSFQRGSLELSTVFENYQEKSHFQCQKVVSSKMLYVIEP